MFLEKRYEITFARDRRLFLHGSYCLMQDVTNQQAHTSEYDRHKEQVRKKHP